MRTLRFVIGIATLVVVSLGLAKIVHILLRGPDADRFRLHILLKDARGVREGTRVVYRGMNVGEVSSLSLDTIDPRIRLALELDLTVVRSLSTSALVWVVRPHFDGLAGEASGLDTLIKENYVRLHDRPGGAPLRPGDELVGLERPPTQLSEEEIPPPAAGDLLATVLLPEKHGLAPGIPVLYRGVSVGEVRGVRLSPRGAAVVATFRVDRVWRHAVQTGSRFWVARPILHGSLLTGITVDDLASLLAPALVFDSPSVEGSPASDGTVFEGWPDPPEKSPEWRIDAVEPILEEVALGPGRTLTPEVEIHYNAVDSDFLSADDDIEAHGEGVAFMGAERRLLVITTRSTCDASFFTSGGLFDRVSIEDERIRVVFADGRIWPARRRWIDEEQDLAVLEIQKPPGAPLPPLPQPTLYLDFTQESLDISPAEENEGKTLLRGEDRIVGLRGHVKLEPSERTVVSLSLVPDDLRPSAQ